MVNPSKFSGYFAQIKADVAHIATTVSELC